MSAMREELHLWVDRLPEERVAPLLVLVRDSVTASSRRAHAVATLENVQGKMRGVTGVDEELGRLRDESRG